MQLIIAPFFWAVLYPLYMKATFEKISLSWGIASYLNHALPLVCMMIDFPLAAIPFSKRHLCMILLMGFGYCITNMIGTLSVRPVYPILTWKDWISYATLFLIIGLSLLFFYSIRWCNNKRLLKFSKKRK